MNRWQHFYDLAATQLAATYAQARALSPDEKAAMAKRFANEAKAFADAFKAAEEAAFEPQQAERVAVVIGARPLEVPAGVEPVRVTSPKPDTGLLGDILDYNS